jgi:hypothetical protein
MLRVASRLGWMAVRGMAVFAVAAAFALVAGSARTAAAAWYDVLDLA